MGQRPSITIGRAGLTITGALSLSELEQLRDAFDSLAREPSEEVTVDLEGMEASMASAEAAIYGGLRKLRQAGARVMVRAAPDGFLERFEKLEKELCPEARPRLRSRTFSWFEDVGDSVLETSATLRGLAAFGINSLLSFARVVFGPGKLRWKEAFYYMEQAGVKAVPIISILCWLLGTVLGYMSGFQLRDFGAETFMPDLVGLSMVWEISPLLAAVIVAGRSGSAFAAELGTMKVRQEVDALEVMGFDVKGYLVVPKVVALLFVMPFLTLLADLFALLGGMLIGGWYLGMPPEIFVQRLAFVLLPIDFYWGMGKSLVYAVIVATVGCFMGMRVRGGAAEVGRSTTSAVVVSIFLVILADALIAILFMYVRPAVTV
ncbi:ABC transporter permease [Candidatus Fermentibacterales bacterium]|nr:ABC transporter permease [Candidatus Fermentibacterales bacterium]